MDTPLEQDAKDTPKAQPLYAQVKALMMQRLIAGQWRPGEMLPSEFQLADQFGVSQGTVRKALDALAADNVLVRRQGRGTFVAEHDDHRALFHFFHLVGPDGERRLPESRLLSVRKGLAGRDEATRLNIARGDTVIRIRRMRLLDGRPTIAETIAVPHALFPDLADIREVPNTLYDLYERRYGITIARAIERLAAVAAAESEAKLLEIEPGAPLLEIDRTALALNGTPVEWRVSRCLTETHHYRVELG
jgi:GntR family transcriptional regulator